eukprot:UN14040
MLMHLQTKNKSWRTARSDNRISWFKMSMEKTLVDRFNKIESDKIQKKNR